MKQAKVWAAALALCLPLPYAWAQEIVVANVGPLSGPLAGNGKGNYEGAKAYFDQINEQGGINGQKIRLVSEDDKYKTEETIRLVQEVAKRDKPVAFVNLLGSATVSVMLKEKTFDKLGIPFIGITPGSESLRDPGSPWLFHVQAGDHAQLHRVLAHLSTVGLNKIAVVYQDLPFGKSGLKYIEQVAPPLKIEVLGRVAVPSAAEELKAAAQQLKASGASVYLMILTPNSGGAMVRDIRASGDAAPIYSLSYVSTTAIMEKTSVKDAAGVALAQVTPNPESSTTRLSRDFRAAMDRLNTPGEVQTRSSMQIIGYVNARVAGEAIRRAGPNPTPEKVTSALRGLKVDLGGYPVDFTTAKNNVGASFVDIGFIDKNGRLRY